VKVYDDSEAATLFGTVTNAKCKIGKENGDKYFTAKGISTDGDVRLHVNINPGFWGGFHDKYSLYSGVTDVNFHVLYQDEDYSNVYPIPNTPPLFVGEIRFFDGGGKLAVGSFYGPQSDFMGGVKLAGKLVCHYPH
jgi:hypothetical protein